MKKLLFFFAMFFMGLTMAFAQVTTSPLTYQSVVRNAQNQLVINQSGIEATVTVWNADGTTKQYEETHTGISTNANGLLTLMVGDGTVNLGTWATIDWSDASIQTVIRYDDVEISSGRAPVTAVPFAVQAGNVTPQVNADWNATEGVAEILNKPTNVSAFTNDAGYLTEHQDLSGYATQTQLNDFMTETNNTLTGINNNITNLQTQITSNDDDITALQNSDNTINSRITADSTALHNALIDTAAAIRGDMVSNVTNLQSQITSNDDDITALQNSDNTINSRITADSAALHNALIDTAAAIRGDMASNVSNLQTQITSNDDDITALQNSDNTINSRITADSTALHNALIDTAAAIRGDIGNGTLTIQTNGTTTGTFTANQATNQTINIDVPAAQVQSNWTETDNTVPSYIQNKPTLATVATTGSYNDLSDKPAINDATLTIQKNGTDVGTFTANQSTAGTIDITVPTTVAELTDATDYATKAGDNTFSGNNTFSGTNDFTSGTVTVPNAITDLATTLGSPCTQNAVNVCDLLALFDSLNRRIAYLEAVVGSVVDNITTPTVTTSQATSVSASKATVGGVLVSAGTSTVTERGVCYSTTNHEPTTDDTKQIVSGTSVGAYSHTLTDLSQNTTYYVKAYAITSDNNIYYGDVVTFTTLIPTLGVVPDQTSPIVVCGEIDVVYTAEMESDDIANYTLAWYVDETVQDGQTSETFTVHSDATTTYTVKCVATRTGGSAEGSTTMNITVIPNPDITLTRLEGNMGDDWGKVEISDAINVTSASWKLNDVEVGTWTSGKTAVLPVGTYKVLLTSGDGCEIEKSVSIRTSPVCVAQTAINSTLETTYELAGQQYVKTIKDHEGNEYNVLQIGTRCWTRENMRVVTSPTTGSTLITNATAYQSKSAQWPYNDPDTYTANKYGVLYNWCAALDFHHASYPEIAEVGESSVQVVLPHPSTNHRGICPEGWHIPVNNDYVNLNSLFPKGGQWATGSDWTSGVAQGPGDMSYAERNISGFSALPAGMNPNLTTGVPSYFPFTAWFVTATEYSATQNWRSATLYLYNADDEITGSWNTSWTGICQFNHQRYSVRCIRN